MEVAQAAVRVVEVREAEATAEAARAVGTAVEAVGEKAGVRVVAVKVVAGWAGERVAAATAAAVEAVVTAVVAKAVVRAEDSVEVATVAETAAVEMAEAMVEEEKAGTCSAGCNLRSRSRTRIVLPRRTARSVIRSRRPGTPRCLRTRMYSCTRSPAAHCIRLRSTAAQLW